MVENSSVNKKALSLFYNTLDIGIIVVDESFYVHFYNKWIDYKIPKETKLEYLSDLYKNHSSRLKFIESLIKEVIKYKSSRVLSQTFHHWIIPIPDVRLPDGLMRQACSVSFLYLTDIKKDCCFIQIRDVSDTVVKIKGLQDAKIELVNKAKELENSNENLRKEIIERQISEKKQKELDLHLNMSHHLESIGTLVGGIAHDFNNILCPIIGYTEMSLEYVPKDSLVHNSLKEIFKAATRATGLVKEILVFNTNEIEKQKKEKVNLKDIADGILSLLGHAGHNVEFKIKVIKNCPLIKANATQMHQVLLNLCTNALHSMEHKKDGIIDIILDTVDVLPENLILYYGLKKIPYVTLSVKDNGQGMEQYVQERLFDPYFTTKPVNKGHGLGLSIIHRIVKNHNGAIAVSSQVDKGSTFTVYLPVNDES
ncbi:MAG: hypothetical protein HQK76_10865 [Desulfobacterales bacterium]|nr:hypothetical protein [Desulfobacterales bacterium]